MSNVDVDAGADWGREDEVGYDDAGLRMRMDMQMQASG